MNVNTAYLIVQNICNKFQSGYITPDQFGLFMTQSQKGLLDYLLGEFQQYQPGRPIATVEIGQNGTILQRLSPLIDPPSTLTIDVTGLSAYPNDYVQTVAMFTNTLNRVRFVQQDSLYSYINSVIDTVANNPIYLIQNNGFQFYPITLGSAKLSYIKLPPPVVWGYVLDGNQRPVYDSGTSTDPIFNDVDMMDVIARCLAMIGINLQSAAIEGYANDIKKNGQ